MINNVAGFGKNEITWDQFNKYIGRKVEKKNLMWFYETKLIMNNRILFHIFIKSKSLPCRWRSITCTWVGIQQIGKNNPPTKKIIKVSIYSPIEEYNYQYYEEYKRIYQTAYYLSIRLKTLLHDREHFWSKLLQMEVTLSHTIEKDRRV